MVTKVYSPYDDDPTKCIGKSVEGAEFAALTGDQFREMLAEFDKDSFMQINVIREPDGTLRLLVREPSENYQFVTDTKEAA